MRSEKPDRVRDGEDGGIQARCDVVQNETTSFVRCDLTALRSVERAGRPTPRLESGRVDFGKRVFDQSHRDLAGRKTARVRRSEGVERGIAPFDHVFAILLGQPDQMRYDG